MVIDNELKGCADVALRNAYLEELAALIAKYREAAAGLGTDMETGDAQVAMYTWGDNADGTLVKHDQPTIWTDWPAPGIFGPDHRASCGHTDMISAFEHECATRIGLEGKIVFERDAPGGEWMVAEGAND